LKVSPQNALVAALALAAAVFAWPAQAALVQCPRPLFWRTHGPLDEAYERMIRFAAKKVAEAPSIFKGHAINAEFIGLKDDFPAFIVTFKVNEWVKGSGQPYARIVSLESCDGCSSTLEMGDELVQEHGEAIYVSDPIDRVFMKGNKPIENIDGAFLPCSHWGRSVKVARQQGLLPLIDRKRFLLDLAMRGEIERLSPARRSPP
jgi:hypothetical protein